MSSMNDKGLEMQSRIEDGGSNCDSAGHDITDKAVAWAVKPGNKQDEEDMRRMGQKQSLSVCRLRVLCVHTHAIQND